MSATHQSKPAGAKVVLGYAGWMVLVLGTGAIGATASIHAGEFYGALTRPTWAPPSSVFGPVWSTLYVLIGLAAGRFWHVGGFRGHPGRVALFVCQLALNALWSWLFFAWHQGGLASAEVVLLWLSIVACIVMFWRESRLAGGLLVPYLLWVTFATALCFTVWRMNPEVL